MPILKVSGRQMDPALDFPVDVRDRVSQQGDVENGECDGGCDESKTAKVLGAPIKLESGFEVGCVSLPGSHLS